MMAVLLIVTAVFAFFGVALPFLSPLGSSPLREGNVAQQDYSAPYALTFESTLLTEARREQAFLSVSPIYNEPDPDIARTQVERLRSSLGFITSVRNDTYASEEQKLVDLAALQYIQLPNDISLAILSLNNSRWQVIQQETIVVLEQVMRESIREATLTETISSTRNLISLSLPNDQRDIVYELVRGFVVPNSLLDEQATDQARISASNAVQPVSQTYKTGEIIIQRGKVISAIDFETLQAFNLTSPSFRWQEISGSLALTLVVMAFLSFYLVKNVARRPDTVSMRGLVLTAVLFLIFLYAGRLIIPGRTVLPYLFPLAAYSLLISALFGVRQAIVSSLALVVLVTYEMPYAIELSLYYLLGSLFGVLALDRGRRVSSFFWSAIAIGASGTLIALAYRLPRPETDWVGIATIAGAALTNGIAATSITLLVQHFLSQLLGNVTALQLYELSRPDHPLLKQLLQKAPGTYQHSLQVANMVEQAAERIGADPLLARVGALYHDIGKIDNAAYFIENQVVGSVNPHDLITAQESASIIIHHVTDGLSLAKKYRLPQRIRDFIAEHHGSSITRYQYNRALKENAVGIKEEDFRYPGPRPQSRETALLMLADATEARVRADHPQNEEALKELITSIATQRMNYGYLQDCDLTFHDLTKIADSFTDSMRGIYHPRLQYPAPPELQAAPDADSVPSNGGHETQAAPPAADPIETVQKENDPH